ncbi:MAG: hypothetical protein U5N85_01080 [Arcicella sp.]|nr:hypothetical protein [Arcicella sp.]
MDSFKNPQDLSKKEKQKLIELWTIPEFKELKEIYDLKNEFRAILQQEKTRVKPLFY